MGGNFLRTPSIWSQKSSGWTQEGRTLVSARLHLGVHCGSEHPGNSVNLGKKRKGKKIPPIFNPPCKPLNDQIRRPVIAGIQQPPVSGVDFNQLVKAAGGRLHLLSKQAASSLQSHESPLTIKTSLFRPPPRSLRSFCPFRPLINNHASSEQQDGCWKPEIHHKQENASNNEKITSSRG